MKEWGKAFKVWMESKQTQMVSPRKGFANSDVNGPSGKQVSDGWQWDGGRPQLPCRNKGSVTRASQFSKEPKPEISD